MGLWTRKPIETAHEGDGPKLRRTLGPIQLVALGVGAIVGAGNYTLIGVGAAVMISFLVAGAVCACVALCYAELASVCAAVAAGWSGYARRVAA
jgi:APA family basic amino acid/polyamine antiporter